MAPSMRVGLLALGLLAAPAMCPALDAFADDAAAGKSPSTSESKAKARPALPTAPAGPRPSRKQVQAMISDVSKQYGVEKALVQAVVAAESNFNAHAVSHAGAVGLMQVMPATAGDYGVTSANALFDAKINLRTGTRHLKRLLRKYKNDYGRVIMAYNAGEGVVDRTNSNVTFRETLDYTEAVITKYRRYGGTRPTQAALRKVHTLRAMHHSGKARRLLKKYLDPSLLSLRVKPTLTVRQLSPRLHDIGPASQPMFELK